MKVNAISNQTFKANGNFEIPVERITSRCGSSLLMP